MKPARAAAGPARQAVRTGPRNDQAHHARLGQREEVAPVGRQRGWIAQLQGGHGGAYRGMAKRGKASSPPRWRSQQAMLGAMLTESRPCFSAPSPPPRSSRRRPRRPRCRHRTEGRSRAGRDQHQPWPDRRRARSRPCAGHDRQLPPLCRHPPLRRQNFYRAMHMPTSERRRLIQGGVRTDVRKLFPPIAHEPTSKTGLHNVAGRHFDGQCRPRDGALRFLHPGFRHAGLRRRRPRGDATGFAAFGHVIEGMDVVQEDLRLAGFPDEGRRRDERPDARSADQDFQG